MHYTSISYTKLINVFACGREVKNVCNSVVDSEKPKRRWVDRPIDKIKPPYNGEERLPQQVTENGER
jgi:hypothetical protein